MKGLVWLAWFIPLVLVDCGPPPPVEEPIEEPLPEPTIPEPPPPPEVRCKVLATHRGEIDATALRILPGESDAGLVLIGPSSVRLASLDEEGALVEARSPLVKLRRATATAAPAGSLHLVVVEAATPRRGASNLTVSRFELGGDRVGTSLSVERPHVAGPEVKVECTAEACILAWPTPGEEEGAPSAWVARVVTLGDEGPVLAGEEPIALPGEPSPVWRRGDAFEVVVGAQRYGVSAAGELGAPEDLVVPRGGRLRLAESPTGAAASMYVESTMPYGLTVTVLRASSDERRETRLWDGASEESRFGLVSGQLGFGAAWAQPEGEAGPYGAAEGDADLARVAFRGFGVAGSPHGPAVPLTSDPVRVGSLEVVGLADGYVVAWTSPARRRGASVSMASLSCWELTDAEAAAERAAAEQAAAAAAPPPAEAPAPAPATETPPAEGGAPAGDAGPTE